MPPRPPLAQTVILKSVFAGPNGTKAATIMHAHFSADVSSVASLTTVAANMLSAYDSGSAGIQSILTTDWALTQIVAIDNSGLTENAAVRLVGLGQGGGGVAPPSLPPNCADVVSWTIPAHYRGGHPRTYYPGVPQSGLTTEGSNELSSGWRSTLSAFGSAFLTAFNAALVGSITETLGEIAYRRNNVALATPEFFPFSGGTVHGRLDSQRRRLGKESQFP